MAFNSACNDHQLRALNITPLRDSAAATRGTSPLCGAAPPLPTRNTSNYSGSGRYQATPSASTGGARNGLSVGYSVSHQRHGSGSGVPPGQLSDSFSGPTSRQISGSRSSTCKTIRHFCHRCHRGFAKHKNWDRHVKPVCETWKEYHCPHDNCTDVFHRIDKFNKHHEEHHLGDDEATAQACQLVKVPRKQHQALGCGFCTMAFADLILFMEHFCSHLKDGKTEDDWSLATVTDSLLQQAGVEQTWAEICAELRSLLSNANAVSRFLQFCTRDRHERPTFHEILEGRWSYPEDEDANRQVQQEHVEHVAQMLWARYFEFVVMQPPSNDGHFVIHQTSNLQARLSDIPPQDSQSPGFASDSRAQQAAHTSAGNNWTQVPEPAEANYPVPISSRGVAHPYYAFVDSNSAQHDPTSSPSAAAEGLDISSSAWALVPPDSTRSADAGAPVPDAMDSPWPRPQQAGCDCIDPHLLTTRSEAFEHNYGDPTAPDSAFLTLIGMQDGQQLSDDDLHAAYEQANNDLHFDWELQADEQ